MTNKKRTTVTMIETHEVWIIRRPEAWNSHNAILANESEELESVSPSTETSNALEKINHED